MPKVVWTVSDDPKPPPVMQLLMQTKMGGCGQGKTAHSGIKDLVCLERSNKTPSGNVAKPFKYLATSSMTMYFQAV